MFLCTHRIQGWYMCTEICMCCVYVCVCTWVYACTKDFVAPCACCGSIPSELSPHFLAALTAPCLWPPGLEVCTRALAGLHTGSGDHLPMKATQRLTHSELSPSFCLPSALPPGLQRAALYSIPSPQMFSGLLSTSNAAFSGRGQHTYYTGRKVKGTDM